MKRVLDPLDPLLRARGAVMTQRAGVTTPAHYGSAAAELSACVLGVGMANRSDLGMLVLSGPPRSLRAVARRHAGVEITHGGAGVTASGWWCGEAGDRALVLGRADARARLYAALTQAGRPLGVAVSDVTDKFVCIALAGRRMQHLLAAVTLIPASGDLRSVAPYSAGRIAGIGVNLLLESDHRALLVADTTQATELWQALETAGRPLGLALIGLDAAERFAMFEKLRDGGFSRTAIPTRGG